MDIKTIITNNIEQDSIRNMLFGEKSANTF